LIFARCEDEEEPVGDKSEVTYRYLAYDSNGVNIVKGCLFIDYQDYFSFIGWWKLDAVGHPENIGPQSGIGDLDGFISNNEIFINLTPEADNNIRLTGNISIGNYSIYGHWWWIDEKKIISQGTFRAVREECV